MTYGIGRSWGYSRLLLGIALVAGSVVASCRGATHCDNPASADDDTFCFCEGDHSCSQSCPATAQGCSVVCYEGSPGCTLDAPGDGCVGNFSASDNSTAVCGTNAQIACDETRGVCRATVGEGSVVNCDDANDCEVRCDGTCTVRCSTGHCRVSCEDWAGCKLDCTGTVTECADGTRACNMTC